MRLFLVLVFLATEAVAQAYPCASFLAEDARLWARIVKDAGVKADQAIPWN